MSERLTEEEIDLLNECLEDGFRDYIHPNASLKKIKLGQLFDTNPLYEDVLYYSGWRGEYLSEAVVRGASAAKNKDFQDISDETLNERDAFALNPFGFNLEKLGNFFKLEREEVMGDYKKQYSEYLKTEDPYDYAFPDGIDEIGGMMNFNQWLENILVPYSRRWFEDHICNLISKIDWASEEPEGAN